MIKKILITTLLWLGLTAPTFARDVQFGRLDLLKDKQGLKVCTSSIFEEFKYNPKDWIAIYKEGDSTAWENVKAWTWAKNMGAGIIPELDTGICGDKGEIGYIFKNLNLPAGKYVARYFLNNTYETRLESKPLTYTPTSNKIKPFYSAPHHTLNIEIQNKNFNPNPKDWIGVYKTSSNNEWKNVRAWTWAKNFKKNPNGNFEYQFKNLSLQTGQYEVRYFLNNTYTTNETSPYFNVTVPISKDMILQPFSNRIEVSLPKENFNSNPKDWIGIYKVGTSNDWENVKAWTWVKNLKEDTSAYLLAFSIQNFPQGRYEARYFLNNTFVTNKVSNSVWVH